MNRTVSVTAEFLGYSLDELKKLRRVYPIEIGRNVFTTVVMLLEEHSVKQIADFLAVRTVYYLYLYQSMEDTWSFFAR